MNEKHSSTANHEYDEEGVLQANHDFAVVQPNDVFGNEAGHAIKYKTLSWPMVAALMITEIVSNGMLSLPQSGGAVGLIPNVILIVFLGIFGTFTAYLLVQFKLNHPEVHNMGDAGYIMFGPIGREILATGTLLFAIFSTGSQLIAGELALATLSDSSLCLMLYTGIFVIPITICSFPRTLDRLSWLSIPATFSILIAGLVGMIGAGVNPVPGRTVSLTHSQTFVNAFGSVTNPVFAYAGHFMFFILISEMRNPRDAMKAAYVLQGFATTFYAVFAIQQHWYLGDGVASPSLLSLPPKWQKAAFAIAIPNFLIAGSLYSHTAAKLIFLRLFRNSKHLHSHTVVGWCTWNILVLVMNAVAFVLAVGIPVFPYFVGIAASLFASWYTYGIAGTFWLHDSYYVTGLGIAGWRRQPIMFVLSVLTFIAGGFICVAGSYVFIELIKSAYDNGTVGSPFLCYSAPPPSGNSTSSG